MAIIVVRIYLMTSLSLVLGLVEPTYVALFYLRGSFLPLLVIIIWPILLALLVYVCRKIKAKIILIFFFFFLTEVKMDPN